MVKTVWVCAACRRQSPERQTTGCCALYSVRVEAKSIVTEDGLIVDCQGAPYCEAKPKKV